MNISIKNGANGSQQNAANSAASFIQRVVPWPSTPEAVGLINLHWTVKDKQGMRGRCFRAPADFMGMAQGCAAHPKAARDVYFCLSSQKSPGKVFNGTATAYRSKENVYRLKALWLDVDVKPGQPEKAYATTAEAIEALEKFIAAAKLPPISALVLSGSGGFHVYWISDQPLTRDEWQPFADGLYAQVKAHGFKADPVTTDCVRILRVPGTFNYKKDPPGGVRLAALADTDLDFEKVFAHIKALPQAVTGLTKPVGLFYDKAKFQQRGPLDPTEPSLADGIHVASDTPLEWGEIVRNCPHFAEAFATEGKGFEQGLWMLDVLATTFMEDGVPLAHKFSRGYVSYSRGETDQMIERKTREKAERGLGWPSCAAFEGAGCKQCTACEHKGKIRSPLNLGIPVISSPPISPSEEFVEKLPAWNAAELKLSFSNIPHRKWLYGTYLIRGEITVLAAPGGAGKTALATGIAIEVATGIEILGEKIYRAHDLRVLFINGEDGRSEIERRMWAFRMAHAKKIGAQSLDRLYVAGADDPRVQRLSFLRTTERNFTILDQNGFVVVESALDTLRPDVVVLDPLVAFCGGGNMNDNAVMALIVRELKRLATRFDCAVLIVHHTKKGADDGNAEAISGAAAIVNLARRAIMPVPMTEKEAMQFGILPSDRFRHFKLVDAKSNLAPRSADSPLYQLHSVELLNAEPPVYPHGDSVQAVARVNPLLLQTATVTADDQKIRNAIRTVIGRGKMINGQSYPYSPSSAGASKERALFDDAMAAVKEATAPRQWRPDDLKAAITGAIKKMKSEGLLVEKDIKELISAPGRFRRGRGLAVAPMPPAAVQAILVSDDITSDPTTLDGGK